MSIECKEIGGGTFEKTALFVSGGSPSRMSEAVMSEAVDMAVLLSLEEAQIEGEPDLIVELIDLYLEDASAKLYDLREAAAKTDEGMLRRTAHCLKGSSGNLGARGVAAVCEELEQIDCNDLPRRAGELLLRLEREYEHVSLAFAAERQRRV